MDGFIQRVRSIEEIASAFPVSEACMKVGREVQSLLNQIP